MNKLNIEKKSIWVLYVIAVLPLVFAALMFWNVISTANFIPALLTMLASGFVVLEITGRLGKKAMKKPWGVLGLVTASVAFLGALLTLAGVNFVLFTSLQGFVVVLLALFAIVEGFK